MTTNVGAILDRVYSASEMSEKGIAPAAGTIYWAQNGKCYKFFVYADGTADLDLAAGDVVYYVDDTGYGASTVTADVSDASGACIGAGVAVAAVTEDGAGFWGQIKGFATVNQTIGGSAGDGHPLTCAGASDKALTKAAEADSTGVYKSVVAIAVDASDKQIICDFPY